MNTELAAYQNAVESAKTKLAEKDAEIKELRRLLVAARHALLSYAHGNTAPALAEGVAAEIEKVIKV